MHTDFSQILQKLDLLRPVEYAKNRNFIDGDVSKLSPYISRGVISTKQVFEYVMAQGYPFYKIEKFVQELAWRDYWQQIWIDKGTLINSDLKNKQDGVKNHLIPKAIVDGKTSIKAIDDSITEFYESGYIHNHLRMYIASLCCNVAKSHWKLPAQWMYYHLLDADWASNALSWQWVCGSNSNKLYYANQNNINKYCYTTQKNTFLDIEYHQFNDIKIPNELAELKDLKLTTPLPIMTEDIKKGLLGIVVDETEVSKVMPEINSLTYRGYAAQDLCAKCKFEEVAYLILNGELPSEKQLKNFEKVIG